MKRTYRGLVAALLLCSACQQKPETSEPSIFKDTGETLYRVRLTASKAEEYHIQTAPVGEEQVAGEWRKVIPAAAVVTDPQGKTWTFTSPEPLLFVRTPIHVDFVDGEWAVLSEGLPTGAEVVTVGADKLVSNEFREKIESRQKSEGDQEKKSSGMATMQEDGSIRLVYRTVGATGLTADIVIKYKPKDEEYQKILNHVGGLRVGETKFVPPWPDE